MYLDGCETETSNTAGITPRTALLVAHAKEYGLLYAIAYFVAADVGLIAKAAELGVGMC